MLEVPDEHQNMDGIGEVVGKLRQYQLLAVVVLPEDERPLTLIYLFLKLW